MKNYLVSGADSITLLAFSTYIPYSVESSRLRISFVSVSSEQLRFSAFLLAERSRVPRVVISAVSLSSSQVRPSSCNCDNLIQNSNPRCCQVRALLTRMKRADGPTAARSGVGRHLRSIKARG